MSAIYVSAALAAMRLAAAVAILTALTGAAAAQGFPASTTAGAPIAVEEAFRLDVTKRDDGSLLFEWEIEEGYYLYRDHLAAVTAGGVPLPLETGPGVVKDDPTFGMTEVYYDAAQAELFAAEGPVELTYQGCQEGGICYPPQTVTLAAGDGSVSTDDASGSGAAPATGSSSGTAGVTVAEDAGLLEGLSARGGPTLVLGAFLVFGLLLAFTPCVFPMLPILAGILAGQGEALTARRGAALSLAYVLAMASAFALLGIAAAWSGANLQLVLQSPAAVAVFATIFVALALSMFGLFEVNLPASWTTRISGVAGRGGTLGGAAALGFTSALIAGPCVTAPLAGALLYIAKSGDVALGATALFAMGLGHGVPLLLVGIFGARVLPRAGGWMEGAKRVFGFVFLALAVWLLSRLIPGEATLALWAVLLVAAGVFLGALDRLPPDAGAAPRAGRLLGVLALLTGGIMALGASSGGTDPLRPLSGLTRPPVEGDVDAELTFARATSSETLAARLASAGPGPALVYVTADWCVTCRVIERRVLPDASVRAALDPLTLVKADVSDFGPEGRAMLDELGAVGPPTMIFLDERRAEVAGTRIVGDARADDLIRSAEALR
ncbi:protein-disulfide reductase DsbD [Rhodosalinus sp.]|uniref:protein-disulfide reductase DsbD n=1 Tax=Rhodosalinus sp. TaxID=2047741 RepID=UPI0039799508